MSIQILDLETDDLEYTQCWNVCIHNLSTDSKTTFLRPDIDLEERSKLRQELSQASMVVMHFGSGFDWWVLRDLCSIEVDIDKVFDTLIVGQLLVPKLLKDHKLATIGEFFGYPKPDIDDFTVGNTPEMLDRVSKDVEITRRWYLYLVNIINKKGSISTWREPIKLETETQWHLEQFHRDGFWFNKSKALKIHKRIKMWCDDLESSFQEAWPPTLEVDRILKYKITKSGVPYATVVEAMEKFPKTEIVGESLICYDYVAFNPNNSKHRVSKLNEAGWSPTIKTDGHYKFDREPKNKKDPEREANFKEFGCLPVYMSVRLRF